MDHALALKDDHTAEEDLEDLKIDLRNRLHRIYSSVFLLERKINNTSESYETHDYFDTIQKELDCIRDRIIH